MKKQFVTDVQVAILNYELQELVDNQDDAVSVMIENYNLKLVGQMTKGMLKLYQMGDKFVELWVIGGNGQIRKGASLYLGGLGFDNNASNWG